MSQPIQTASSNKALVAVGSNAGFGQGDAAQTVRAALGALRAEFSDLSASPLYRTPAFPAGAGPDFANAACAFETELTPADLLATLHRIEADFGRERTARWAQRSLDLDLIAYEDVVSPSPQVQRSWMDAPLEVQMTTAPLELILPHPRLQDRSFVLVPLFDVAPHWRHPLLGRTIAELLSDRPDTERAEVVPW